MGGAEIKEQIPEIVIQRLPLYARALALLERDRVEVVSSQGLGARLGITPAQIRKDLSYFGRFGRQGKGYNVKGLLHELWRILGLDREWPMVLVGVGRLGQAIIRYGGFIPQDFRLIAAFDRHPRVIGRKVGHLEIQDISQLKETIEKHCVDIGIVAVPAAEAQGVINMLAECGVRAILNYAPVAVKAPSNVRLRMIDPVVALQSMTFYLK